METNTVSCDLQYECTIINNERSSLFFCLIIIIIKIDENSVSHACNVKIIRFRITYCTNFYFNVQSFLNTYISS